MNDVNGFEELDLISHILVRFPVVTQCESFYVNY
jgi:hypothetical protein